MRGLIPTLLSLLSAIPVASADDARHWAFRTPVAVEPPAVTVQAHADLVRNPIDQFLLSRLEAAGLELAPAADRDTLVRRAYFDLLGLPPTPEQVEQFVHDDSPQAWQKLIDTLLESPHYGERWGRHWLDVARYADSGGYETDIFYRNAWRYRDYVVKSFNDNKPYNIFVQEQIAGDELWPENLDLDPRHVYVVTDEQRRHQQARIGTGFYALGPRVHESGLDGKRLAYENLTDWVDTTASAFMGLTLGCARCHDHKFDPFTQDDYYSLQAIFAEAREVEWPLWHSMEEADWRQHYPRVVAVEEARRAYRQFEKDAAGKELTPEQQTRKQELLTAIANAVLALPERAAGQNPIDYVGLMHIPMANVLGREHPALIKPVHLLDRGELSRPREQRQPALPVALAAISATPPEFSVPQGSRKGLALWLTQPDHPLTARVFANRVWQWHFGRGIVETPNDFGKMGQPASHPELLDWLAVKFIEDGWNIKNLQRLMMNSAAYRQSSRFAGEQQLAADPENRLLWRMNRRRLESEALWDSVHSAAGTINLAMGGPPVVPPLAADEIASLRDKWHWVVSADPAQHTRRGIYVLVRRNFPFPMFEVFDTPVNSVSCPTRDVTTVAPQALWGLNNRSVYDQAVQFAGRVAKEAGAEPGAQVERAWKIALGRAPTADESAAALALLNDLAQEPEADLQNTPESLKSIPPAQAQALSKFCLALFNLSEFGFVD
ncbi:MAG: DUF1549 and DUF1553 domain-containing protein [Planctomycetaceae bacterium]